MRKTNLHISVLLQTEDEDDGAAYADDANDDAYLAYDAANDLTPILERRRRKAVLEALMDTPSKRRRRRLAMYDAAAASQRRLDAIRSLREGGGGLMAPWFRRRPQYLRLARV